MLTLEKQRIYSIKTAPSLENVASIVTTCPDGSYSCWPSCSQLINSIVFSLVDAPDNVAEGIKISKIRGPCVWGDVIVKILSHLLLHYISQV